MAKKKETTRRLTLVLGDQLDAHSAAFDDLDPTQDAVWMAEVSQESTHVWTHKARIALFLTAMRHFRDELRKRRIRVEYCELEESGNPNSLTTELDKAVRRLRPQRLILVEPGEWRVKRELQAAADTLQVPIEFRPDRHFLCSHDEFQEHAAGRKQLRLEFFYREMRRKTGVLMEDGQPVGGSWNFDAENRGSFDKNGPVDLPPPRRFKPDSLTRQVLETVERRFADHPGSLEHFDWPVTVRQARQALDDFIQHRLSGFGEYQDAMWVGEPYLYHSRLSAALNLKLLDPRDVIHSAEAAYRAGAAPLNAVEGFIRQILGWREYVRGIYWRYMPEYLERNALDARHALPDFYWTGQTQMRCLHETIRQTLDYGYAHHIQRLMVTGLFALLWGVDPRQVHQWYLAVYVDAVEWVELPNTLGMSQFADGGVMASKPYVATGKYIQRMSNYCQNCAYRPDRATGEDACPFTTLYWDFLMRHEKRLRSNPRMTMQLRNLDRKSKEERQQIRRAAAELRKQVTQQGDAR